MVFATLSISAADPAQNGSLVTSITSTSVSIEATTRQDAVFINERKRLPFGGLLLSAHPFSWAQ